MKLIDADVLKEGINTAREEIRANYKNGNINYKMYVIMNHILDVFEDALDVMPEYNSEEGEKNDV